MMRQDHDSHPNNGMAAAPVGTPEPHGTVGLSDVKAKA
jgi:hypothetical protein